MMNEKKESKPLIVVDKVSRVDALKYSKLIYPTLTLSINSTAFVIWQVILLVAIIYDIFINSFEVAYLKAKIEHGTIQKLVKLVSWLYLLDIIIRSNTTFINNKSEEICLRSSIFRNYRRSFRFYMDLVAALPIETFLQTMNFSNKALFERFFAAHRLFKVFRLAETYRNIEKRSVYKISFMILRVIFQLSFQLHIISCLWYAVVLYSYDKDKDSPYIWLPPQLRMTDIGDEKGKELFYESKDLFFKYTQTFYSVLAQMCGNDINVSDEFQVFLSIIIGLLGSVNLGIILGNVMLVYQKLSSTSNEYLAKLNQFREDVQEHEIPDGSKMDGLSYLEFCYNIKKFDEKKDDFTMLSRTLQMQVDFIIFKKVMRSFPLFMHLSDEKILKIIQLLKYSVYTPNSYIYNKGDPGNEIYFLMSGTVRIYVKDNEYVNLGEGKYFGEICFYNSSKRNYKAVAKDYCIIFVYNKRDHLALMKEDQEYREGIKRGKEEVKNQRMEELLGIIRDRNSLSGFTTFEIMQLVQNYSELVYLEEEQLLISPAYSSTCKFLIISGKVGIYEDNYENQEAISKHYLKKKMMRNEFNTRGEVQSIDRHILKQYDHKIDDDVLSDISTKEDLEVGSWFGSTSGEKNDSFVITKSFVELLMINQARLDKLRRDNYYLYQKFTNIFQIDNRTMKETMGKIGLLMIPGDDGGDNKSILSDRSHGSIAESTFNKPLIESNLMVLKNIKDLILKLHNK